MHIGASTFIWVSPFSNQTLDLIDQVKAYGFDLIEICIEDPATIDTAEIRRRLERAQLGVTICGAFGPNRDMSSEDPVVREAALRYTRRCIDIATELGSPVVIGPMYAGVGNTRMLTRSKRRRQWDRAVDSVTRAGAYAGEHGVTLGLEPLNRFETDLLNTVDQGVALLADIGRDDVGLLLDTFHMNIEEKGIPDAIRRAGRHIVAFHACAGRWRGPSALARDRGRAARGRLFRPDRHRGLHAGDHGNRQGGVALAAPRRKPGWLGAKRPAASPARVRLISPRALLRAEEGHRASSQSYFPPQRRG